MRWVQGLEFPASAGSIADYMRMRLSLLQGGFGMTIVKSTEKTKIRTNWRMKLVFGVCLTMNLIELMLNWLHAGLVFSTHCLYSCVISMIFQLTYMNFIGGTFLCGHCYFPYPNGTFISSTRLLCGHGLFTHGTGPSAEGSGDGR